MVLNYHKEDTQAAWLLRDALKAYLTRAGTEFPICGKTSFSSCVTEYRFGGMDSFAGTRPNHASDPHLHSKELDAEEVHEAT